MFCEWDLLFVEVHSLSLPFLKVYSACQIIVRTKVAMFGKDPVEIQYDFQESRWPRVGRNLLQEQSRQAIWNGGEVQCLKGQEGFCVPRSRHYEEIIVHFSKASGFSQYKIWRTLLKCDATGTNKRIRLTSQSEAQK